jgi:pantoate--beta-alanine ligase
MQVVSKISDWQGLRASIEGKTLGFVPTMGALHAGHLSLVQRSRQENDLTLVSIFVNATQFNAPEDLQKYPRCEAEDLRLMQELEVDYVLMPDYQQLYPDDFSYQIHENQLSRSRCGVSRPGHFTGVLTVVMKLLNLAQAHRVYFGEKDYQQLELIQGLVAAFFIPTMIVPCPTIRETDGLALSSRNIRLSEHGRKKASLFYQVLQQKLPIPKIKDRLQELGFEVDYIEDHHNRRYGAVYLEGVRLIDNVTL